MKTKINLISLFFMVCLYGSGCKKYLEAKSNESLVVINNLQDLQSLLDNFTLINGNGPSADEASTDEYFLTDDVYRSLSYEELRNMYIWAPQNLFYPYTNTTNDWNQTYNKVYVANTVLDNMDRVDPGNDQLVWNNIKGQAHFLRALTFYKIAGIWSLAYDAKSSETDLGIPLRLSSDFNRPSVRSSVSETYSQILEDAKLAARLMSNSAPHVYRGSRPAAYALLSAVYLSMRNYGLARTYADSCLLLNNKLLDYNTLNTSTTYPVTAFNQEILYGTRSGGQGTGLIASFLARIPQSIYAGYSTNDLRRTIFFATNPDNSIRFRGSYEGTSNLFNGLAVDEVYLIRAECLAREGRLSEALSDLNTLLRARYRTGTLVPLGQMTQPELIALILMERQKELIMRGTRWMDIKRLNKEGAGIALSRTVNGIRYVLPSNDPRFALPIPEDVISLSGMPQNPR